MPRNLTKYKARAIGPRQKRKSKTQQEPRILGSVFNLEKHLLTSEPLKKGFDLGSKAINSDFGKKINDEGTKHAPDLYKYGAKEVKNNNLKTKTCIWHCKLTVEKAQKELFNWRNF